MKKILFFVAALLVGFNVRAQLKVTLLHESSVDSLCAENLSNSLKFFDFQHYLLITNRISGQQYIFWKDKSKLRSVPIDSALVKSIYIDFLKDPQQYSDYIAVAGKAQLKPKVKSLCPYDDSTVLGCMETFRSDTVIENGQVIVAYTSIPSILEIGYNKPAKLSFVNDSLPIAFHSLDFDILSYNKTLYCRLVPEIDALLQNKSQLKMLARMKRHHSVYRVDSILPESINDYLITNEVYDNYNTVYFDQGFSLMSLSDHILNLETGEQMHLPIPDSVFRNVRMDPRTLLINYLVYDFKYNKAEQKFYIKYAIDHVYYVASFRPHATQFDTNELLYAFDSDFCKDLKNTCLSWDGKRIVYSMKGENCFHYVSIPELQRRAREYKRKMGQ